jgi:hypothetical protein
VDFRLYGVIALTYEYHYHAFKRLGMINTLNHVLGVMRWKQIMGKLSLAKNLLMD